MSENVVWKGLKNSSRSVENVIGINDCDRLKAFGRVLM